jgi:glycerol-3-phosphate dehydrogenase (NAD(P)+)
MGDLVVTCMSPHSRNRHVGERLGRGEPLDEILGGMNQVAEGVKSARIVHELSAEYGVSMPIAESIHQVVNGEITPAEAFTGLREPGHEAQPG